MGKSIGGGRSKLVHVLEWLIKSPELNLTVRIISILIWLKIIVKTCKLEIYNTGRDIQQIAFQR